MSYENTQARDLQELNIMLRNSFSGIKQDMGQLKASQSAMLESYRTMQKRMLELKKDSASKEELKAVNQKITDLKQKIDQINEMEAKVKELKDKAVKELKSKQNSFVDKSAYEKERNDVKRKLEKLELGLKKTFSHEEYNTMAAGVGKELGIIKKDIKDINSSRKSTITKKLNEHSKSLDARFDRLQQDIDRLQEEANAKAKSVQVEKLVNDINKEFDKIKEKQVDDFTAISNELEKSKEFIKRDQVEKLIDDINKEFDTVKTKEENDLGDLKEKVKDLNQKVKDMKTANKEYVDRQIEKLKKNMPSHEEEETVNKKAPKEVKQSPKKAEFKKVERQSVQMNMEKPFLMSANISIIVSFVILIASIVAFFSGRESLMNGMIITAIVLFVIGVLIRIFVIIKNRD
jgi:hypothetical protein